METTPILARALMDISAVDARAAENDAAYRKQIRIILNSPGVQHALARARDAPEQTKPARKRTAKPNHQET